MTHEIQGARTAIKRKDMSAPARWVRDNTTWWWGSVLDFGCGHGADVAGFNEEMETVAHGWDPAHARDGIGLMCRYKDYHPMEHQHRLVMVTYVLNVLPYERWESVLWRAELRAYADIGRVVVTVRRDVNGESTTQWMVPDDFMLDRGYEKVTHNAGFAMFVKHK